MTRRDLLKEITKLIVLQRFYISELIIDYLPGHRQSILKAGMHHENRCHIEISLAVRI